MKTLLLSAKYFAIEDNSEKITLKHLEQALEHVELVDKNALKLIKNELPNVKISVKSDIQKEHIDKAASAEKIEYDAEVKQFILKLRDSGYDTSRLISKLASADIELSDIFTKIKNIKEELNSEALGQQLAIEAICDGLMRAEYRQKPNSPKAVFLLAGSKSPIKSYVAKEIGALLSDYEYKIFKMSAYGSGNGGMQLFGTPEPYSGAKAGLLTAFVKANPKSILVFEDIELSDKESHIHFAKIIEEGACTDSFSSEVIDFSQTIIVFTTAAGKEVYAKHDFMMMAQSNQKNADSMILDAISREEGIGSPSKTTTGSSGNTSNMLFDSSFMAALRKANVALFGKIGFSVYVELVKRAIVDEFDNFENKMGIKLDVENIDDLTKLSILASGPDFDLESIKEKMPTFILDIVTDGIIANGNTPKRLSISLAKKDADLIGEIISSADDIKLLNNLFRKSQTVNFEYTYNAKENELELHSFTLDRIKRAKDYGEEGGFSIELPNVTFADIAGHHRVKERLKEAINILKSKQLSEELGDHMPKGMLLYGPPGTGKTMLAKAFAKEADLPFIATTGPDLLSEEMMKSVFSKARDYAPAIVFIDEIDVFRHRGKGYGTDFLINKLLTLIDGFSTSEDERIFIVAATNLKENIDEAIIRSGRIDLHILVDYLDRDARAWFVDKMLSKQIFDAKIDREKLLRYTANMSGADLQKVESESILYAARRGLQVVTENIVLEQINTLKYGSKIEDDKLDVMLTRIAYHEAGHAVISKILMPKQKIEQITVAPRSNSLGFVSYVNDGYQSLTRQWFENKMCVCFAGRSAEMKKYGEDGIDSGAGADLKTANGVAYQAIAEFGMDEKLRNISKIALGNNSLFDKKVEEIIKEWMDRLIAKTDTLVEKNWSKIEKLATILLEKEVVEELELEAILAE